MSDINLLKENIPVLKFRSNPQNSIYQSGEYLPCIRIFLQANPYNNLKSKFDDSSKFLIDTGATVSLLTYSYNKLFQLSGKEELIKIEFGGGVSDEYFPLVKLKLKLAGNALLELPAALAPTSNAFKSKYPLLGLQGLFDELHNLKFTRSTESGVYATVSLHKPRLSQLP